MASISAGNGDWPQLRQQFPVTERWAFMDHAAVAPISLPAGLALGAYAKDLLQNGDVNESQWTKRMEEVRGLAARLLNADPLDIAFVKHTSEGIGFVAEGFPWRDGDNVVVAAEEYPSNIYPWMNLKRRGVECRLVPSRGSRIAIDDVRARMDGRTRVLSLSYVEFASGYRNDLHALGQLCRERGVYFFMDAIQGLGVLPLDVAATPIDFLSADGHKWLLGPEGAGLFWCRREHMDLLSPLGVGWHSVQRPNDFSTIDFRLKPHAGRYEGGSLNVAGITALGASIDMLLQLGIDNVRDRVLGLTDLLCERLAAIGWQVFSSRADSEKSGIVSVTLPNGCDGRALLRRCREGGVVVNLRAGRLRISPHCYNNEEDVERLTTELALFTSPKR
jgi:selenocysteine lyase/cysteine desulfurase